MDEGALNVCASAAGIKISTSCLHVEWLIQCSRSMKNTRWEGGMKER
jgi:hypothetical protein